MGNLMMRMSHMQVFSVVAGWVFVCSFFAFNSPIAMANKEAKKQEVSGSKAKASWIEELSPLDLRIMKDLNNDHVMFESGSYLIDVGGGLYGATRKGFTAKEAFQKPREDSNSQRQSNSKVQPLASQSKSKLPRRVIVLPSECDQGKETKRKSTKNP